MDTTGRVLARLDRVERLDAARATPEAIVAELQALVAEAESWARAEGDDRALRAVSELRRCAEGLS